MEQQIINEILKSQNPQIISLLHIYEKSTTAAVKLECEKRLQEYISKDETKDLLKSVVILRNRKS